MYTPEINFSPLTRQYSLEELWALPEREDGAHYDLIGGFLFLVPRSGPPHGDVLSRMCEKLVIFEFTNNIAGDVYFPHEPICRRSTYLEPDLMYVLKESQQKTGAARSSADIVFECLSRETIVYDCTTKADTYLALGVGELWLMDPFSLTIEVRHASKVEERVLWKMLKYSRGQNAKSRVLEGFEVSVDELFAGII